MKQATPDPAKVALASMPPTFRTEGLVPASDGISGHHRLAIIEQAIRPGVPVNASDRVYFVERAGNLKLSGRDRAARRKRPPTPEQVKAAGRIEAAIAAREARKLQRRGGSRSGLRNDQETADAILAASLEDLQVQLAELKPIEVAGE
jgi:hypothetical protein